MFVMVIDAVLFPNISLPLNPSLILVFYESVLTTRRFSAPNVHSIRCVPSIPF